MSNLWESKIPNNIFQAVNIGDLNLVKKYYETSWKSDKMKAYELSLCLMEYDIINFFESMGFGEIELNEKISVKKRKL